MYFCLNCSNVIDVDGEGGLSGGFPDGRLSGITGSSQDNNPAQKINNTKTETNGILFINDPYHN
jgi:hypothetical protein